MAFSAIAEDGSLVISCWHHLLMPHGDGQKRYEDRLSRFTGSAHGKNLVTEHVMLAFANGLPVRLVVATLEDPSQSTDGDASDLKKTFSVDQSVVGKVVEFDGDQFAIEFEKAGRNV